MSVQQELILKALLHNNLFEAVGKYVNQIVCQRVKNSELLQLAFGQTASWINCKKLSEIVLQKQVNDLQTLS